MGSLLAIVLAVALASDARAQDQAAGSGRIEGRVRDASGQVLPGVRVTLTDVDAATRQVVTDADGRFVFDDVRAGARYVIRGELPGFSPDSERDIAVTDGQTRTIDLELQVACVNETGVQVSDLDDLLTTDAIAYVRVGDAGEDQHDYCGPSRAAVVISAMRFSDAGQRIGETFRLMGAPRFERGREYLLFLSAYGTKHLRASASFARPIVDRRIRGVTADDIGIRSGLPIEEALTRLREVRQRYSRYRSSEREQSLETLRHKTGWVLVGAIDDGSWVQPSFEFLDDVSRRGGMPRPNDRIRMTKDETIYIPEFWAKGDERRMNRPSIQHLSISDQTGARVEAGAVYTVADVRLESIPDGRKYAWVRLVTR